MNEFLIALIIVCALWPISGLCIFIKMGVCKYGFNFKDKNEYLFLLSALFFGPTIYPIYKSANKMSEDLAELFDEYMKEVYKDD